MPRFASTVLSTKVVQLPRTIISVSGVDAAKYNHTPIESVLQGITSNHVVQFLQSQSQAA